MKIKVSAKNIIKFIIFFSIAVSSLSSEIGLPQSLFYINDVLLCLVLCLYYKKLNVFKKLKLNGINYILAILISVILIGVIGNLVPLQMILWGMRNTFRGILFLFLCVACLNYDEVSFTFDVFIKLQYLNFVLGIYQYFVLGLKQDTVGGIFGHGNGNALCIFCVIVCSYTILNYMNEKVGLASMLFCIISSFILAGLAEEKFLIFEIIITIILALALSKKSLIKLVIIPVFILMIFYGLQISEILLPGIMKEITSVNYIEKYVTASWLGSYYIPRIGSYSFISNRIFHGNKFLNLFGFGMGNCDTSSFSFFQSYYYKKYGYMNYRWIFQQWTIMENGIIGFLCIVLMFIIIIYYLLKIRKKFEGKNKCIIDTSIITGIISIMTMWMNNTLKMDTAYIPYFVLGAGFVCYKEVYKTKLKKGKI